MNAIDETSGSSGAQAPAGPGASAKLQDTPSVLIIDDEPSLLRLFEYNLRSLGHNVRVGGSIADLLRLLEEAPYDALLLDLMLPDGESLDHLPAIVDAYPWMSVIMVTAHGTIPKAVSAIHQGAVNFIQKPVTLDTLEAVVSNAIELSRLKRENNELRRRLEPQSSMHGMIGQSESMQKVYEMIDQVAGTMSPVMITGESGTGKELVAKAIHARGQRSKRPFIAINCAAIPRDLLESEIFGHEKGAFTGAIERHDGCFERADKGTLFLDEIGEMDVGLQVKLLRLIQEQTFFRIGGTQQITVNVRILAATNRDPLEMVHEGKFREDLFYRLNVLPIHLPPLRERREDIAMIATHFLHEISDANEKDFEGFEIEALEKLEAFTWSGNVRELRNVIEQMVVLNDAKVVSLRMLPDRFVGPHEGDPARAGDEGSAEAARPAHLPLRPFWQVERDEIQRALNQCQGNVQEVARRLEISAATLYRKIEKYGLVK